MAILSVYQPRDRKTSPLWQVFNRCYKAFEDTYDEKFEKRFGFFRAVIGESVRAFLKCGDLKQGFARIRCPNCEKEQLAPLSFSCKKRCICGSCMAKRAIVFGLVEAASLASRLNENVFYPVPHRQYVFSIPIMLRVYFKYDRSLLTGLCQRANRSLLTFLREVVGFIYGVGSGGTSITGVFGAKVAFEHSALGQALLSSISPATAFAFIFALFFSIPCIGTLGAIYTETRSMKWTVGSACYYTCSSIIYGALAYHVGLIIF